MKKLLVAAILVVLVTGTTFIFTPKLQVEKTQTQENQIITITLNSKKLVSNYLTEEYDQLTSDYLTSLFDFNKENKLIIEEVPNYLVISNNENDQQYYYNLTSHQNEDLIVKDEYLDLVKSDYTSILKMNNLEEAYTSKIKDLIDIDYNFKIVNQELVFTDQNDIQLVYPLDPYLNITNLANDQFYTDLIHPLEHYVNPDRPIVVLTMDDGPVKEDLDIIELFNEYQVTGTFFQIARRIYKMEEVELAIINQGSEIGSHSYRHPNLTKIKDDDKVLEEMTTTEQFLKEYTNGEYDVSYLRPPYGAYNQRIKDLSPYTLVMWSIDTEDWKNKDTETIISRIDDSIKDGSIILMHDIHPESREAMKEVIPHLLDSGYQVCSLSELAKARNVELEAGQVVNHIYN